MLNNPGALDLLDGGNYFAKVVAGAPGVYSALSLTIGSDLATSFSTLSVSFLFNFWAGDYNTVADDAFYVNASSFTNYSRVTVSNLTLTPVIGQFVASGWRYVANIILPAAAIHTLQFGVRNARDALGNSAIYIDNVNVCVVATPTPTSTSTPSITSTATTSSSKSATASVSASTSSSPTSSLTRTPSPTNFVVQNRYGFETNSSGFNNVSTYFGFQNCVLAPWVASNSSAVAVVPSALNLRGDTIRPKTGNCMAKITAGIVDVQNSISLTLSTLTRTNFSFDFQFVPMDEVDLVTYNFE
jgi:hypothetical protein